MDRGDLAIAGMAVVLVFLGAALTILIEVARGEMERKQRRDDRRDDFQRETLIEIQDQLAKMSRAAKMLVPQVNPAIFVEDAPIYMESLFRLDVLLERLHDETLRGLVAQTQEEARRLVSPEPGEAVSSNRDERSRPLARAYVAAMRRSGELLRDL